MTTTGPTRVARRPLAIGFVAVLTIGVLGASCKKKSAEETPAEGTSATVSGAAPAKKESIQNIGSDTMVNLAQAWAEEYAKVDSSVSVEVSGGGSGVGIAALI